MAKLPLHPLGALSLSGILMWAAVASGCVTTETRRPMDVDYTVRSVVELGRWEIATPSGIQGHLVHLEIQGEDGPIQFYRVVNERGEWVGHVTDQLRFSRRIPFEAEEQVMGIFSMKDGLAHMLDLGQPPELVPTLPQLGQPGALEATHSSPPPDHGR